MTPQDLDRLRRFTVFLSGTFKSSSFGEMKVDEMVILLVQLIEEQNEFNLPPVELSEGLLDATDKQAGGFAVSEDFRKAMIEWYDRPRPARLRSRILYHMTLGRYGRLRTYPVIRSQNPVIVALPKETQK